jgi:hypothetical protein
VINITDTCALERQKIQHPVSNLDNGSGDRSEEFFEKFKTSEKCDKFKNYYNLASFFKSQETAPAYKK